MRTYDPMLFGALPEDAIMDPEALTIAYEPQPDLPFLEDNADLPDSSTDPRGLAKDMGTSALDVGASDMATGNELSAPESGGAPMDQEAIQQAILDAQMQYNSNSVAYQDQTVAQNDEDNKKALMIEEGLA